MSKIELPPLPQPAKCWPYEPVDGTMYTADQLRARDRQIVEVCIQAAENAEAGDGSHDYNAGAETMQERIVAALRNLIEESNNG